MEGKSLWASKTFWVNLLGGLVHVLPGIAQAIPQPYGILGLAVANIALRLVTKQPISGIAVS